MRLKLSACLSPRQVYKFPVVRSKTNQKPNYLLTEVMRFKAMVKSDIKLVITFSEPRADEERLDRETDLLLQQIKKFEEVQLVERIPDPNPPDGSKPFGSGCLVGMLKVVVDASNMKAFLGFLGDRLAGKAIEMEVEANGKKLKVKASSQQEFAVALQAAKDFLASA